MKIVPFNPHDMQMDVDLFEGGGSLGDHLNRLAKRVNAMADLLGADKEQGGGFAGVAKVIGCNANGQPALIQVLTIGTPQPLDTLELTPGTGSFRPTRDA